MMKPGLFDDAGSFWANRQPLLFLDFDGVLHSVSAHTDSFFTNVDLLEQALEGTNCGVVISSSWRFYYSLKAITAMLPKSIQCLVQGTTGPAHIGRWPRYNEILVYLQTHCSPPYWRALDDSWIEFPPECEQLIVCNPTTGISESQKQKLKAWLQDSF
jgi:hypothetical protein